MIYRKAGKSPSPFLIKIYVPPCLGKIVPSSAQHRAPQRAATPQRAQIRRERSQEPTLTSMKLAVMKIPEPMIVPTTKQVVPTRMIIDDAVFIIEYLYLIQALV